MKRAILSPPASPPLHSSSVHAPNSPSSAVSLTSVAGELRPASGTMSSRSHPAAGTESRASSIKPLGDAAGTGGRGRTESQACVCVCARTLQHPPEDGTRGEAAHGERKGPPERHVAVGAEEVDRGAEADGKLGSGEDVGRPRLVGEALGEREER